MANLQQAWKGIPWTLRTAGGETGPVTWELVEQELNRLGPREDSFVILEQQRGEGEYWFIQSAVALAGPHAGAYIVGCGWSSPEGPALAEWYGDYAGALARFRRVWEEGQVDFTGFQDLSDEIPVNRVKNLLEITCLEVGPLGTNCYILTERAAKQTAVIDPGGDAPRIIEEVRKKGGELKYILLTHGHYDHVDGLPELAAAFPEAEIYIHRKDVYGTDPRLFPVQRMLEDPECPLQEIRFYEAFNDRDVETKDAKELPFGSLNIHPIHTFGHSEGSVTLRVSGGPLFCGDVLFAGSCGRTDFPGGNWEKMMSSLRLFGRMSGDAQVFPGHMGATTLEEERQSNPYLRQALGSRP